MSQFEAKGQAADHHRQNQALLLGSFVHSDVLKNGFRWAIVGGIECQSLSSLGSARWTPVIFTTSHKFNMVCVNPMSHKWHHLDGRETGRQVPAASGLVKLTKKPVENIFSHNVLQCRQSTIWSERFYTRWNPPTEPKLTQEGSSDLSLAATHWQLNL